jgi:nucleoside-diphosphate-sugar epimerase
VPELKFRRGWCVRQFAGSVRRKLPAVVDDLITTNPQTSYGTQKVIGEYLVNDYSRKGFLTAAACACRPSRAPPGKPNLASTSFASGMFRSR